MDLALSSHFRKPRAFYYFLTFVNNSTDPLDQIMFTIGRVNDWFRRHKDLCRSWFIVREEHKDGRNHYHALADLDLKCFKPSKFVLKIQKIYPRVHIQARVNGQFVSSTFCKLSKTGGCAEFVSSINFLIHHGGNPPRRRLLPCPNRHGAFLRQNAEVAAYLTKSLALGDLVRYQGWVCSCHVDHFALINLFPTKILHGCIFKPIFEFLGNA